MTKTVYIAEKPSLGKELANALGGGRMRNGYIEGSDWIMTWTVGHAYGLLLPPEYDEKYKFWSIDNLPILPSKMRLKVSPKLKGQIAIIKRLLSETNHAVNCGDAGREGQLLIDEILDELKFKGKVDRVWIKKMTESGLKESLQNLKPNSEYQNFSDAASCRRDSDWLVGFNFSPLFTLVSRAMGNNVRSQNIGRVMTPTLRMVVERDLAIENFVSKDFYELIAGFSKKYDGKWQVNEDLLDAEGYLTNKKIVEEVKLRLENETKANIDLAEYKTQRSQAPMPYTLIELQKDCSRAFGWTSKKTLDIAQKMYEQYKMTTYPRTDCPYLSVEQKNEAAGLLSKTLDIIGEKGLLSGANFNQNHSVFNDKKLGEHHAIIPTGECSGNYNQLPEDEKKAFNLIVRRYLALFYPPKLTKKLFAITDIGGEKFHTLLSEVIDFGWESMIKEGNTPKHPPLPVIATGDTVEVDRLSISSKKTSPPSKFTEDLLLTMMERAGRLVESSEDREILGSISGIGTATTRSSIIDKLTSNKVGFLARKGRYIVSTDAGRDNIKVAVDEVTSPTLTAEWEKLLKKVETGELSKEKYEQMMHQWITNIVNHFKTSVDFSRVQNRGGNGGAPSVKQLAFAKKIAQENSLELPVGIESDYKVCSSFIDKTIKSNKKSGGGSSVRPPSDKQLAFAKKLSKEKSLPLPKGVEKNSKTCSNFIDKALKK